MDPLTTVDRDDALQYWADTLHDPDATPEDVRMAENTVALYDRLDAMQEHQEVLDALHVADTNQIAAMRECLDRLRSGWRADNFGDEWHWRMMHPTLPMATAVEPMTEAQRAVMEASSGG